MARKPQAGTSESKAPGADSRETVIDALLSLAAARPWDEFGLEDVAEASGIGLAELRGLFPSRGAVLAAFARRTDIAVLAAVDKEMSEEPARERLFDVLMQRLAVMKPHREAIAGIGKAFAHDPLALAAWNKVVVNSMQWMLVAAKIGAEGPAGAVRAQGLALAWGRILKVWLADEDPGIARTMTEIDRQLRSGERWMERADDFFALLRPLRKIAQRSGERRARFGEKLRGRFRDFAEGGRDRDAGSNNAEAV